MVAWAGPAVGPRVQGFQVALHLGRVQRGDETLRRRPRGLRFALVGGAIGEQFAQGRHPRRGVVLAHHGARHGVLVEHRLVALDGVHRDDVPGAVLGLHQAAGIAGHHGDAAQHALHDDEAEAFVPQRRHEQHAGARQHFVDIARVGQETHIGQALQRAPVVAGGAPTRHHAEFDFGQTRGGFEKDGQPLDGARIDHGDQPGVEVGVIGERAGAVDRRMNHHRFAAQRARDVVRHVMPDGHHSGGLGHQRRGFAIGIPTGGTEGEELRRVGQVDHAAGGRMAGLAQESVAQVFARYQHPIGLELANLLAQHLYAARGIFHGEHGDGRVKAQLGAFAAGAADDAAGVSRGGHLVQPDEIAARGAAARRHVTGIGG